MNLPEWLTAEIARRAEEARLAEADLLARKAAYDAWAQAYSAPMVTVRSLDLTKGKQQ